MVSYLHRITVKIPTVCTSSVTSIIAPICASSILFVHPSDNECQEILEEFYGTNYREKDLAEIVAKIPDNVALTLHIAEFPETTSGTFNGGISW